MLANKWTEVNLFITKGQMTTVFEGLEFYLMLGMPGNYQFLSTYNYCCSVFTGKKFSL